jgi:D-lactate dehydrogenase
VTAHQAFFTEEALSKIATVTLQNIDELVNNKILTNKAALLA